MPHNLPPKRIWLGYGIVALTVLITWGLWLFEMGRAGQTYESPWIYFAKIGSHGTLILMCWAFLLATRFSLIERTFGGLDKVYRAHRVIGEAAFFLIFLHPLFLALGKTESPGEFFAYFWFSDNWVRNTGIIALLAFIFLVAVSIYVKIAYHRWKRTHDFFGVLMVLIVIHAVLSNGEIMRYPVLTLWHGLWVGLGLSAYAYIRVFYRWIGPQYDYQTESVTEIGDAVTEIALRPLGRPLRFEPGQFIYISFDADAVTEEPHPFSISSGPEDPNLRLSIKRLGDWTHHVSDIRKGELARIWGPYGHFSRIFFEKGHLPAVCLGGGIGITPFLSMLRSSKMAGRTGHTHLVYSVPDRNSQVYRKEIEELGSPLPEVQVQFHISNDEGFIDRSYLENLLSEPLPNYLFLVCGPPPMMNAISSLLRSAGLKPQQIVMESFAIR